LKITPEKWQRLLDVNLTGTFNCCQAVVPDMVEEGWGRIVNISSSSAHGGQQFMTHYVAAKAGVIGFTKSLADAGAADRSPGGRGGHVLLSRTRRGELHHRPGPGSQRWPQHLSHHA
jgi:NAD(P)-dependent dehydrogenase (short-subunit alcohol dehydrogenase family)